MKRARGEGWRLVGGLVGGLSGIVLSGCGPAGELDGDAAEASSDVNVQIGYAGNGRPKPPGRRSGTAPVPVLAWAPCGPDLPGVECAVATVPLDYGEPCEGATTGIALARVPAADPAHKIGTVFVNPGGPGGSGVDMIFAGSVSSWAAARRAVRHRRLRPRGVGGRNRCTASPARRLDGRFTEPAGLPLPPSRTALSSTRYGAHPRCRRRPRIAAHMSTADVVRDLDLLRQGGRRRALTYLGVSYGRYIGNTYANLFPDKVRALVIDGVLDPRLWSSGRQIGPTGSPPQAEFDEFLRLCDAAGRSAPSDRRRGRRLVGRRLAAALRREPLVASTGRSLTPTTS